tara:strand:+ start:147 stop:812 length:666 start_codon:yes stop_codon:yes gene_type:complete
MGYFRELPNMRYPSFLPDKNSSLEFVETKNLFRRIKLRDDFKNIITLFDRFEIPEGLRPDTVAEGLYGSDELDWVVLITAGITNVRNQWPLSSKEVYDYSLDKYGTDLDNPRYWVTKEIKDSKGKLIMAKDNIVDPDFSITFYDSSLSINVTKSGSEARTSVSNYEYETLLNDKKRNIFVLKPEFLQQFLNDFRDLMVYDSSSQFINDNMIETENTSITLP